jgi:hypothetical protein
MKLRIRGNSVRVRVSKSELDQLAAHGAAEDAAQFGPGAVLRYRLEAARDGALRADFTDNVVRISIPRAQIERWLEPDEVSIRGEQALGSGEALKILVEKDYVCLAPRSDEDDSDLFANPERHQ